MFVECVSHAKKEKRIIRPLFSPRFAIIGIRGKPAIVHNIMLGLEIGQNKNYLQFNIGYLAVIV